ncbi:MAG TPA: DegT/DnrJ/EryC1/StrS family aminotransferase [Anaerolineales bacterium]|nr:DegT/DnrJ/EryC1/StrS family aminotransferase [Anaerolineales bacterium]
MVNIPVVDLKAQYESIRREVDEVMARVLRRGTFILGEEVDAFQREFAAYCGVSFAVGVGSGTAALYLALRACEIGKGDEVVTTSHTSVATVAAIELAQAKPVLVDIDPRSYTLDLAQLESALTPRTRAIIPVHLYGCPAEMSPILEMARQKKILVLEDCAQAHGARYAGKRVGGLGTIAAFSFYPTKNLGAYGDGGAVLTNDSELAKRLLLLRQYGWEERYISSIKGVNSRLDDLQAAVLRVKLHHLDEWNKRRCELASLYDRLLTDSGLALPVIPEHAEHVFHQYVIRHPERDQLRAYLKARGIQTLIHYPVPVHLQPAYKDLGYHADDLPISEAAAKEVLSLPLYPEMSEDAVKIVCQTILEFTNENVQKISPRI